MQLMKATTVSLTIVILIAVLTPVSSTDYQHPSTADTGMGNRQEGHLKSGYYAIKNSTHGMPNLTEIRLPRSVHKKSDKSSTKSVHTTIEQETLKLVNKERSKKGLKPLKENRKLSSIAKIWSNDMRDKCYFGYDSPKYGNFRKFLEKRIRHSLAAQFIAAGRELARTVVDDIMESKGNRNNMYDSRFKELGVGYAKGGSQGPYWTLIFMKGRNRK